MSLVKFKALPLQLQLDSILYALQGSGLICLVHTALGDSHGDKSVIQKALAEWHQHRVFDSQPDLLINALEYADCELAENAAAYSF